MGSWQSRGGGPYDRVGQLRTGLAESRRHLGGACLTRHRQVDMAPPGGQSGHTEQLDADIDTVCRLVPRLYHGTSVASFHQVEGPLQIVLGVDVEEAQMLRVQPLHLVLVDEPDPHPVEEACDLQVVGLQSALDVG